jgi:uncharacterized protein (TIGR03083 family)
MEIAEYVRHLDEAGHRILRAAKWGDLAATVPTCPDWTLADLVRHVCEVHSWAEWILRGGDRKEAVFFPPDNDSLLDTFDTGLKSLVGCLEAAPDSLDVWSFLPAPSPKAFWARRQAHETTIHAVDAEYAVDCGLSEIDHDLAVDGLDELLVGFAPRRIKGGMVPELRSIMFAPVDANISWTVDLRPDASATTLLNAPNVADLSVMATAENLYLWAWNRASDQDVTLRGDMVLADLWRQVLRISWS